ncbi:hypothetical protein [Hymenobacter sp. GOD-10R]|uniref:hypothetical protein n=1 Tax=Hymenobacter sp. GOD-10R TaxID=3093922 RepID=UPI002D79A438|nr:hypothetical protein [Hymenobacter sp. GOD-10R]WRQ30991.1 hypothetical protein SD425_12045 [Hymenobacter sp. GOD-10R]
MRVFLLSVLLLLFTLLPSFPLRADSYWNADYDSLHYALRQQRPDLARLHTLVHLLDVTELTDARLRSEALPLLDELLVLNGQLQEFND